ncbi:hypothetical protein D3C78_1312590 [compost metagenome]
MPKPRPTPTAPPITDSAVRSTPTMDSDTSRPTVISTVRVMFIATLRIDRSVTT